MNLEQYLKSEEGSTGLSMCMPRYLLEQNPEVVPGPENRTEEEFDLEFYDGEELIGMADYDRENEVVRIMTLEPTEWHSRMDRDFVENLSDTFSAPVITWYSSFEDGCIASIYCLEEGHSLVVFRLEDGRYEADYVTDGSELEECEEGDQMDARDAA
ncbi:MAG: hypothetical protein KDK37_03240 [Leptospiraceae bacterium]|nr:hypothetical protein [Leptospiraceae bacterium]MCB1303259.1 hypothetical protein [Leptospiraceae bacterium]